jgi:hypothetical protein
VWRRLTELLFEKGLVARLIMNLAVIDFEVSAPVARSYAPLCSIARLLAGEKAAHAHH